MKVFFVVELGTGKKGGSADGGAWGSWVPLDMGLSFAGKNSRERRGFYFGHLVGWGLRSITRSPAQGSACKDLERDGQGRAITPEAAYTPIPNRAGSRSHKKTAHNKLLVKDGFPRCHLSLIMRLRLGIVSFGSL